MRKALLTAAPLTGVLLLAATGAAGYSGGPTEEAGAGSRQRAEVGFTDAAPARPSAIAERIDYVNPNDRDAKPYAVQRVELSLSSGSRIRTSVPARCRASDAELVAEGASACPRGSRVGRGRLVLDSGSPGPGRFVRNRVKFLNDRREIILLTRTTNTPTPQRAVSRGEVGRRSFITTVPPIPGGPPDGFTAVDRVNIRLRDIAATSRSGHRGYITTPPTCPVSGAWTNRLRFTYRDGVTQTELTRSACRR